MTRDTMAAAVRRIYRDAATRGGLSDADLLGRFAATRDEAAFEVLVWRHGPMVLGACRRVLRSLHDAEDAFQATFVTLAARAESVRPASLSAWLHQVAYHAALRVRKGRARHAMAALPGDVAMPGDGGGEVIGALDEELQRLPRKYREPLVLAYLEGHTNQQVADALGCPVGTVFTRLARGRERLRAALARRGIGSLPVVAPVFVPPALVGRVVASALTVQASGILTGIGGAIVLHKMKAVAAALLMVTFVAAGVILPQRAADVPKKARAAAPPVVKDPLPEGALLRLGSMKFRQAGLWEFVCLPGGKSVLTTGTDGVLRTWDLSTGRQVRAVRPEGLRESIDMTLSTDGRAAVAHTMGRIVLWDAATGKEGKTLAAPKGEKVYLSFSRDGQTLAVRTYDWLDLHDLKKDAVRTVALPARVIKESQGSFSDDGRHLSLGGGSNEVLCIYDVSRAKELHRFMCHATGSVFSPDGKSLIVSSLQDDKREIQPNLRIYDVGSGKEVRRVTKGVPGYYYTLEHSPDGKTLVCSGYRTACVRDARTLDILCDIKEYIHRPRYSLDGKKILSTTGGRLRFWDPTTGKEIDGIEGEFGTAPFIAISPDGRLLASGDWDAGEILLWDLKTGRVVRKLALGDKKLYPRSLSFSVDGKELTVAQYESYVQTWDVATGKETRVEELANSARRKEFLHYYDHHFSPDGKTISTLEFADAPTKFMTTLVLWDRKTLKRLHEHILPGTVSRGAWRPDGLAVAVPLPDGLTFLDVKTGKPIWRTAGPVQTPIHASPDFRLIVGSKSKTTLGVWESATGKEVASLDVGTFARVALASDNRTLVITDAERIRVVDLASGKEVRSHALPVVMETAHGDTFVKALALTPDARRAFTSHADGTGLVWDIARKRPARIASDEDLAAWWADLASPDAGRAWRASWALSDANAGNFVKKSLHAPGPDAPSKKLLDALDSDSFEERENAEKVLGKRGSDIAPSLRLAREKATSPEQRRRLDRLLEGHGLYTADAERRLRAAGVLEMIERGRR